MSNKAIPQITVVLFTTKPDSTLASRIINNPRVKELIKLKPKSFKPSDLPTETLLILLDYQDFTTWQSLRRLINQLWSYEKYVTKQPNYVVLYDRNYTFWKKIWIELIFDIDSYIDYNLWSVNFNRAVNATIKLMKKSMGVNR